MYLRSIIFSKVNENKVEFTYDMEAKYLQSNRGKYKKNSDRLPIFLDKYWRDKLFLNTN